MGNTGSKKMPTRREDTSFVRISAAGVRESHDQEVRITKEAPNYRGEEEQAVAMTSTHEDKIPIVDFGSQYTQLIARAVRALGVYCELHPYDIEEQYIRDFCTQSHCAFWFA
jgi:GMP synthase - Glutamine amidotransferase domain